MDKTLKIKEQGDFYAHKTVPAITLQGKWLEKAGFPPNKHVQISQSVQGQLILTVKPD